MLLANRYTVLTPLLISEIRLHMNKEPSILTTNTKEKFSDFINSKSYLSENFIDKLREIAIESNKYFHVAVTLDEYINSEDKVIIKNLHEESILISLLISMPLWNSMENYLEVTALKNRVKKVKI